jgi:hypothetical protein
MFYSQSLNCCLEARAFLACSALTAEPCHGFTGDCASLLTVFAALEFDGAPGVPADYTCEQFPVADSYRDSFLLGLISWACSLPVTLFVLNCFCAHTSDIVVMHCPVLTLSLHPKPGCANETDYDGSWLRWDFLRRLLFGRFDWRYQARKAGS